MRDHDGLQNCLALKYAVEGDLRFISHHDTLRLFERAMARAEIHVRYSQGFNPRPRMRIVLPRPVGVESHDEWLVIELTSQAEPSHVLARLSSEMPAGITLLSAQEPPPHDRMVPCGVSYAVEMDPDTSRRVANRASEFMAQSCVVVDRVHYKTRAKKTVNVRRYILEMHVIHPRLTWTQSITPTGTARPDEVFEVLKLPSRDYLHRLVRENVTFSQ